MKKKFRSIYTFVCDISVHSDNTFSSYEDLHSFRARTNAHGKDVTCTVNDSFEDFRLVRIFVAVRARIPLKSNEYENMLNNFRNEIVNLSTVLKDACDESTAELRYRLYKFEDRLRNI